jgi:hypothetical protein
MDVDLDRAAGELRDRLGVDVERRDLDVDAVLRLELLEHVRADVVGVVEDAQRAGLGFEAVVDALGDGPVTALVTPAARAEDRDAGAEHGAEPDRLAEKSSA